MFGQSLNYDCAGGRQMGTQKQSRWSRLRYHAVRLSVAGLLAFIGLIPANVARAQTPNLVGEWQWHSVGYSGKLRIRSQTPSGTFSGELDPAANDPRIGAPQFTKIEGRIQGDRIEFVRRILWNDGKEYQQRYSGRLVGSGDNLRMIYGSWVGFDSHREDGGGDFSAEKISQGITPLTGKASGANDRERP